jgi:hypothetical protein
MQTLARIFVGVIARNPVINQDFNPYNFGPIMQIFGA